MNYAPTDCLSIDGKLVAGGYGSSFVHEVSAANGQYTGMSYGGKGRAGSATAPVRFDCNHGMGYDAKRDLLVFTDRANSRLVYTSRGGAFLSSPRPPSGGLIRSRSSYNRHTVLIGDGNPAAEARTARQAIITAKSHSRSLRGLACPATWTWPETTPSPPAWGRRTAWRTARWASSTRKAGALSPPSRSTSCSGTTGTHQGC